MNLNLVIDTSQFKPFDINPALLILHDYRDAYYKYLDRLDKIAEENGLYILPDTEDNKAYKDIMSKYNADFEAAASDFSKHMNLQNQRELLNLFRRQRSEITPINKAIEAYNKDVDKITALGPDVTIANRNNRKISDYYGGVNPGLDYRNNKSIQATAAGVMQGLDNALMSSPEVAGNISKQYYILKQQGIDGKDALLKILSDKPYLNTEEGVKGVSQVMDALNTVYSLFAFDEGTPENKLIWEQVVTGAIQGILAPKYSQVTNRGYETPSDKRQLAYQEAQMAKSGYIYNPKTGKYEYDKEAAITEGGTVQTATLPDGSTWNYDTKKKQWTSPDLTYDGIPRTSAQLLAEEKRQLLALKNGVLVDGGLWKRNEENQLTDNAYITIGEKFEPFEFKMDDYAGFMSSEDERGIRATNKFRRVSKGGAGFKGATDGEKFNGIGLNEADIPADTKTLILREALKQIPNLTLSDLVLYVDLDYWSDDHIRVCIRGTGEGGNYVSKAPTTRSSGSSPSTNVPKGL